MTPLPEITIEDLVLVVGLAVILSLLFAQFISKTWHTPPFCWFRILKNEKCRSCFQTAFVIVATYLVVWGLWLLCSLSAVSGALHNIFFTTHQLPFRGAVFACLITALLGWFGSLHLRRILLTEEKLRISEDRFRRIFEHSATGMMIIDPKGCFTGLNRAFCRMVGYEELELLGLHFTEITHPDDRENCLREVHQLVEGKSDPLLLEKRYCRKNGDTLLASVIGTIVRDSFGHPLFLVGQVLDITERRLTETAILQSETKFRILVEQSLVGVYIIQAGKFIYANPRLAEMTGYSVNELLKLPSILEVVAEKDRPLVEEQIRQRTSGKAQTAHYAFQSRRKDGSQIMVEVLGTLADYNGHPALLGTASDITQQHAAESALRELSGRLLNLQDEERRRIARELHDNTAQALAALTMNLALLQHSIPNQTASAQKIITESLHLAERSVQEIRTLSYLLHPPELDMVGLPAAIREYAAGFAQRSEIETVVEITPDIRRLTPAQELAIFRIVQEALGNILRHSQSATARITLKYAQDHVTLEIRDWGQGIPPAILATINRMHGQIGVGFAGMRERLRQLNGTLKIKSSSAGTTVHATIPTVD